MKPSSEWTEEEREDNRKKYGVPDKRHEVFVDGIKWQDEWNTHLSACQCMICRFINNNTKKKSLKNG